MTWEIPTIPIPAAQLGSLTSSILFSTHIPFIDAPSGTMGNNGAMSAVNTLNQTYPNAYIWLPAGAISSGSAAGWYFCQMSSTTAGTVYNNVYTTGQPTIPATPTPFGTTGPGAWTGTTLTVLSGPLYTIPPLTMGFRDSLRLLVRVSTTNNANAKTFEVTLGTQDHDAQVVFTSTAFSSALSWQLIIMISAIEATNLQISSNGAALAGVGAGNFLVTTLDMTQSQALQFIAQHETAATDTITLEGIVVELLKGS